MIKSIRYVPDQILLTPARPLNASDPHLAELIVDLKDTMLAHNAIGLAAPQIGVSKQIFCYRLYTLTPQKQRLFSPEVKVVINPKIISYDGGETQEWEGCLSLPDVRLRISRAKNILLSALNENFVPYQQTHSDLEARIIQHETDHLHGIFMLTRFGGVLGDYFLDYNRKS